MYGEKLLLCKVILGKIQFYKPDGSTPPEIPEDFDSRVILRDGLEVFIIFIITIIIIIITAIIKIITSTS